jgi:hypothetical protein
MKLTKRQNQLLNFMIKKQVIKMSELSSDYFNKGEFSYNLIYKLRDKGFIDILYGNSFLKTINDTRVKNYLKHNKQVRTVVVLDATFLRNEKINQIIN